MAKHTGPSSEKAYLSILLRAIGAISTQLLLPAAQRSALDLSPFWLDTSIPLAIPSAAALRGPITEPPPTSASVITPAQPATHTLPSTRTIRIRGSATTGSKRLHDEHITIISGTATPIVSIRGTAGPPSHPPIAPAADAQTLRQISIRRTPGTASADDVHAPPRLVPVSAPVPARPAPSVREPQSPAAPQAARELLPHPSRGLLDRVEPRGDPGSRTGAGTSAASKRRSLTSSHSDRKKRRRS